MKLLAINIILLFVTVSSFVRAEWPMSIDPKFDTNVEEPMYSNSAGPKILLDGGHHNFFIQWDFIKPFADLVKADGYQAVVDDKPFTTAYLAQFDIVVIITALPFDFTTKTEVTTETTFTKQEINSLYDWVNEGGSLLVFSEHAPFDQAINPLLSKFGIVSSVGTISDGKHHDKSFSRLGWIVYSRENRLLNSEHPIIRGKNESEAVHKLLTFGGSSLTGDAYTNILKLSPSAKNL